MVRLHEVNTGKYLRLLDTRWNDKEVMSHPEDVDQTPRQLTSVGLGEQGLSTRHKRWDCFEYKTYEKH